MNAPENFDALVLGGGTAGKLAAWTMAKEGRRTAVVDRKYIGGSCPNIACLPSKNVIYSAKVASLVGRQREFGIETGPIVIDMAGVYARKRDMVDGIIQVHLDKYREALDKQRGDELMFGEGTFVAPRTVHVRLRDGGERTLTAERVFVNLGSRATTPDTPGLREAQLWEGDEALVNVFEDIEELALTCRFTDCAHATEPGCAIKAALEAGTLDAERFRSYRKLQRELRAVAAKTDARIRLEERKKWKQISVANKVRVRF